MHKLFLTFLFFIFLSPAAVFAQETPEQDTTIYVVADKMPRFPGCEKSDTTEAVIYECAQSNLLSFIYGNVRYPYEAREQNIEGTAVVSFVVEKDGTISDPRIVKDLGGGTGEEVLRVVSAMNEVFIRWRPGMQKGKPVRVRFNLPVKFKLEEAPEYLMIGRDSVYTVWDDAAVYTEGENALTEFTESNPGIPTGYQDSCFVGSMDVSLLINPDGSVKVLNVNDYNNLGYDFQFEAIRTMNMTAGKWTSARRNGREVPVAVDLTVRFASENAVCADYIEKYNAAEKLATEGETAYNAGEKETGLEKINQAIEMFPQNANFLYLRGQIYMAEKDFVKACEDFTVVRNTLTVSPVEDFFGIICR